MSFLPASLCFSNCVHWGHRHTPGSTTKALRHTRPPLSRGGLATATWYRILHSLDPVIHMPHKSLNRFAPDPAQAAEFHWGEIKSQTGDRFLRGLAKLSAKTAVTHEPTYGGFKSALAHPALQNSIESATGTGTFL